MSLFKASVRQQVDSIECDDDLPLQPILWHDSPLGANWSWCHDHRHAIGERRFKFVSKKYITWLYLSFRDLSSMTMAFLPCGMKPYRHITSSIHDEETGITTLAEWLLVVEGGYTAVRVDDDQLFRIARLTWLRHHASCINLIEHLCKSVMK